MKTPAELTKQAAWQIPGWCWPRELDTLHRLAEEVNSKCHIEVGVFCGKSLWATANAMTSNSTLHLIDPMEHEWGIHHLPGFGLPSNEWATEVLEATLRALHKKRPDLEFKFHKMAGLTAATLLFKDGVKADTIYIDAGHRREDAEGDILAFLPLLNPGGRMYGHDYWSCDPGVMDAVQECFKDDFYVVENTRIWVHEKK